MYLFSLKYYNSTLILLNVKEVIFVCEYTFSNFSRKLCEESILNSATISTNKVLDIALSGGQGY